MSGAVDAEPPQEAPPQPLPQLREDLRIMPGPPDKHGAKTWLIHDPLAHKFHALAARGFNLLAEWQPIPPNDLLARINQNTEDEYTQDDVEDMAGFLYAQKLTIIPPSLNTDELRAQEKAAKPAFHKTILHKYLFFRIPLFRPQRFLDAAYPFIAPLYSKTFRTLIIAMGVIGGWFALEQWGVFKATFLHFLTFEGLLYYGLTLAGLKALHELGHAFMSRRFGCKVPIIGIAFLVMFPILYTDTTDAWRLTKRRERVLIDAAGMLAELCIACAALFAWSFLPDGPLRSAAFFAATTSWGLSLLVNLNPMMRFDGYYLLADLFAQPNLRERAFALGKWRLRETLFGLGHECPHAGSRKERFWLLVYAYFTWVYLFFLFIGIAVLVHALFPKALGIFLFIVEILFFIVKPIVAELLQWWRLRMDIFKSRRFLLTSFSSLLLAAILFIPWQASVRAPALLQPALQTAIFPKQSGRVSEILIADGEHVERGQVLVRLTDDGLAHETSKTQMRIKLINAQLSRRAADRQDLNASTVLARALQKETENLSGLRALAAALEIRAPHSGIIKEINPALHTGRTINTGFSVARLIDPSQSELVLFVSETHISRIKQGAAISFIADEVRAPKLAANINFIAPTSEEFLTEPVFSSNYRGPIAVVQGQDDRPVPARAIIRLKAVPAQAQNIKHAQRGAARIAANPESLARAIWRRISHVLIREVDF